MNGLSLDVNVFEDRVTLATSAFAKTSALRGYFLFDYETGLG
jgi:hypothetical protein